MTDREPVETKNLDRYGNAALPWSRAHDMLETSDARDTTFFLGTTQPDGRPHSTPVGAIWQDGDLYFVSGDGTRKSRNLAANPACTISVKFEGLDLVLEGKVQRVTDQPILEKIAKVYRDGGWPARVEGDAFNAPFMAPSGGPPPWQLYRFTFDAAFGVATKEPNGATRWKFKS